MRAAASLTKLGQVKRFRERIEHFSDESKTAMGPWLSKLLIDKHRKLNDFLKRAQFHQFPNLEIVPSCLPSSISGVLHLWDVQNSENAGGLYTQQIVGNSRPMSQAVKPCFIEISLGQPRLKLWQWPWKAQCPQCVGDEVISSSKVI